MTKKQQELWKYKQAATVQPINRFILLVFVTAGIASVIAFANWWFRAEHVGNPVLYVLLTATFWYGMLRLIIVWTSHLRISRPEPIVPLKNLSVAIFTTSSPGEPLEMFAKTLAACRNITYPHTTYLLDDTNDPRFKALAEEHGAVWLELIGIPGAKAGKINAALQKTTEDFILVLDPDHIPFPNFLDNTLGFFRDEKVGFVQVSQAYYNQYRSFAAKGAAEQTYTFYGPTQMGLYGLGCSVAIGANCTFRRSALASISGHGIGLAEDLITSVRIHAAGWKSVYNPVVVSRGLVPEDLGSFCKQQLKWSRGVFEVTFHEIPKLFRKLNGWQRLSYLSIGTYYFVGATQFFFTLLPFLFFAFGLVPTHMPFAAFISHSLPVLICSLAIYLYVQRWMCDPATERGIHWRGMVLKYACWPVFFLGFLLALVDADIPYIPTAKKAATGSITPFARPLLVQGLLFLLCITALFFYRRLFMHESALFLSAEKTWGMAGFALVTFVMCLSGIATALEAWRLKPEDSWDGVELNLIKIDRDEK